MAERPSRRDERRVEADARAALRRRLNPYEKEIAAIESRIAELSRQAEATRAALADPALYDGAGKGERLKELTIAEAGLTAQLAQAEDDWLHASANLEAVRGELAE